jgi:hypothetical protein
VNDEDVSTCRTCGARWLRRSNVAHCIVCHRTFGSNSAAAMHRPGDGKCLDPSTVVDKNGNPKYGEPRTTKWGTPVWRKVGRIGGWREHDKSEDADED